MGIPAFQKARKRFPGLPFFPLFCFLAVAAVFLVQLLRDEDTSFVPSVLIDKPVPDFSLPPLTGLVREGAPVGALSSTDFEGVASVVNVFASWCGPCRQEHPALMALAADDRVRVVGINYKDVPENARRFLGELGNPYDAVGVDERGRAAIDWGVYGVPETFLVGPDGVIRRKFVGPINEEVVKDVLLPHALQLLEAGRSGGVAEGAAP